MLLSGGGLSGEGATWGRPFREARDHRPGREALAAALHPAETDFLYFVSNNEGGHYFARTGREHVRNVARYRRLRAQKQQ